MSTERSESLSRQEPGVRVSGAGALVERLNGPWHARANLVFFGIIVAHWAEHVLQAYQVYVLGLPRPHSHGALGMLFPWLNTSEWLHYGYAVIILAGLALLRPGFVGRARTWWTVALLCQAWHLIEHSLLLAQALTGHNLFGGEVRTSLLQLLIPRVELHLFYTAIVFLPMVIALWYHLIPPIDELPPSCTCALMKRVSDRASVIPFSH